MPDARVPEYIVGLPSMPGHYVRIVMRDDGPALVNEPHTEETFFTQDDAEAILNGIHRMAIEAAKVLTPPGK